jgi:hypothetical protein
MRFARRENLQHGEFQRNTMLGLLQLYCMALIFSHPDFGPKIATDAKDWKQSWITFLIEYSKGKYISIPFSTANQAIEQATELRVHS